MGRRRGASETRAHGDSAEVRPSGARSLGGEGTYATVEIGITASGGLGFFVWTAAALGKVRLMTRARTMAVRRCGRRACERLAARAPTPRSRWI